MRNTRNKLIISLFTIGAFLGLGAVLFSAPVPVQAEEELIFAQSPVNAATPTATATASYDVTGASGVVQCGNTTDDPCTVEDIFNLIVIVTNLAIGLAGFIAVYSIVGAGFDLAIAGGNQEKLTAGKKRLTGAFFGLMIIFLAFIFINVILYGVLGLSIADVLKDPVKFINTEAPTK
jgi:hypothetical protein